MFFEELSEINENLVFIGDKPEQYKSAILGLTEDNCHVVYSYDKLRDLMLAENKEWTVDDAEEWLQYNVIRGCDYMGECKPLIIYEMIDE